MIKRRCTFHPTLSLSVRGGGWVGERDLPRHAPLSICEIIYSIVFIVASLLVTKQQIRRWRIYSNGGGDLTQNALKKIGDKCKWFRLFQDKLEVDVIMYLLTSYPEFSYSHDPNGN